MTHAYLFMAYTLCEGLLTDRKAGYSFFEREALSLGKGDVGVTVIAVNEGNPARLIYGVDAFGATCVFWIISL